VKDSQNYPLYSIGVVSELLDVHPETIRTWEKSGVVQPPQRRSGKRFYSEKDYLRLQFIHRLVQEGLTLRAVRYYLRLYPCWKTLDCTGCQHASEESSGAKPCWQKEGTYCQVAGNQDPCIDCEVIINEDQPETVEPEPDTMPAPQVPRSL
jgi:MerR family transcriptional regulator/heat shock protein HspR